VDPQGKIPSAVAVMERTARERCVTNDSDAFFHAYDPLAMPFDISAQSNARPADLADSPEALAFSGMLVTASYEPDSTIWPLNAASPAEHRFQGQELLPSG
jgi:hypothetical protein